MTPDFLGKWKIQEMETWDRAFIDLVVPGYIEFKKDGTGSFQFGAVTGWLDCRVRQSQDGATIEFSWDCQDDADPVCGRGHAATRRGELHGMIFIHRGDESSFRATRMKDARRRG